MCAHPPSAEHHHDVDEDEIMCRGEQQPARFPPDCGSLREVKASALQLLQALRALHASGAAHGALRPDVIRVDAATGPIRIVSTADMSCGENLKCDGSVRFVTSPHQTDSGAATPPVCVRRSNGHVEPSLWYRAPEEQVRSIAQCLCDDGDDLSTSNSTHNHFPRCAADIWAAGCMLAEMSACGMPLFESCQTEFELLSAHCDILGFEYQSNDIEIGPSEDRDEDTPTLRQLVPGLCECGHDLLERMLCCDWRKRITAEQALEHPFFTSCDCLAPVSPPVSLAHLSCASTVYDDDFSVDVYESFAERLSRATSDTREAHIPTELSVLIEELRGRKRRRDDSPPPPSDAKRRYSCDASQSGEICV